MPKAIARFDRNFISSRHRISFIGNGSPGGKALGLIRATEILEARFPTERFPHLEVTIPRFTVLCSDIFDTFMQEGNLYDIAYSELPDDRIVYAFQQADLPFQILGDLRSIVEEVRLPLAVRSSSLLEDAMYEPFAGIYETKMTPNNQPDADTRFRKLVEAIKFVYASTFFKAAKQYRLATGHESESEKMAVIIQEVVGERFGERFYPILSGVARSYNFYASGRAKPEDGVVDLALGLGKTIVDGGLVWSYSPAYPKIGPPFGSTADMLKNTQTEFWAVNMGKPPAYDPLKETEYLRHDSISEADRDGTLRWIASTVNSQSGRLSMGTATDGPRILDFAPLLRLQMIPFNDVIRHLLKAGEETLEAPVEIEFAMNIVNKPEVDNKHRLGFLQVRPMVVSSEVVNIPQNRLAGENVLVYSDKVLGNGVLENVSDIVYIKPDSFDAKYPPAIALQIAEINKRLVRENRPYILIGFGRWGCSDRWLGIPVNWSQVSGAKVIVEAMQENMNVDLSQGSHFFHNLTSFSVLYFSIPMGGNCYVDWDWLQKQTTAGQTEWLRHLHLNEPLYIAADGRTATGVITKKIPSEEAE